MALATGFACASAPQPPRLPDPRPLLYGSSASMTQEVPLGASREVRLEGQGVTFRAPTSREVELTIGERFDTVRFDIGTQVPVDCQIHRELKPLANFLAYHPSHPLDPPTLDAETRRIAHMGTGAEAGHAFLTLHWVYPGPEGFGVVKQAAANAYDHTIFCRHREPGFEATFEEVFRTILSTFLSDHGVDPYYGEIVTLRIGDRPVGVESTEMRRTMDGRSRIDYSQALLPPRGPGALVATDVQETALTSVMGDLLRQRSIQVQAGALAHNLVLQAIAPEHWRVSGIWRAQRFDHVFESSDPLRSALGAAIDMRDQLIDDGSSAALTISTWLPEMDPGGASRVHTEVTGVRSDGHDVGVQTVGDHVRDLVLDIDGSLVSGATDMGPATLHMERVWVAGSY